MGRRSVTPFPRDRDIIGNVRRTHEKPIGKNVNGLGAMCTRVRISPIPDPPRVFFRPIDLSRQIPRFRYRNASLTHSTTNV